MNTVFVAKKGVVMLLSEAKQNVEILGHKLNVAMHKVLLITDEKYHGKLKLVGNYENVHTGFDPVPMWPGTEIQLNVTRKIPNWGPVSRAIISSGVQSKVVFSPIGYENREYYVSLASDLHVPLKHAILQDIVIAQRKVEAVKKQLRVYDQQLRQEVLGHGWAV